MYPSVHNVNSALKNLETEATDARLRKRKQEREISDQGGSLRQGEGDFHDAEREDNLFSINALILFLEDFLEARLLSTLHDYDPTPQVSSVSPWVNKNISNTNEKPSIPPNKAASAYARGANTIKRIVKPSPYHGDNAAESKVNDVYHLLRDLRDLRNDGHSQLRLDGNAGTFFEGISRAVQIAKQEHI